MAEFPTKRIINLGEQSEPQSGDYIVTDNQTSGTKKTPASALAKAADLAAEQTARAAADNTLGGQVTDLKSDLNSATHLQKKSLLTNVTWELGTFDTQTGQESSSTTRIRSKEYVDISDYEKIEFKINIGYKYTIYCFDSTKAFVKSASFTNWQTEDKIRTFASTVKYLRFLVADTSDGTASTGYASQFTVETAFPLVVTVLANVENASPDINNYSGIDLGWVIGTLNSSNGDEQLATNRIRSKMILLGRGSQLVLKSSSYRHLMYIYDLQRSFVSASQWKDDTYVFSVTEDCYVRILMKYSDDATIDSDDVATISANEIVQRNIPSTVFDTYSYEDPIKIYGIGENILKKAEITVFKQKKTSSEGYGQCDLKMMFFTDVHGDSVRTQRMTDLVKAWGKNYFNVAICGGDIATDTITEDLDWYYSAVSALPVPLLNTVGNHDAWANLNGTLASKTDVYDKIIAPITSSSAITQPANASTNGYNYYYKDFNSKVRIIVLDCMFWDATQLSWFESVLADAKTNSLAVLCVSHAAFPIANMEKVDCLWSKSGLNTDGTRTNIQAASAVKDFMDDGGVFIAWLVGHQHGDYVHKLPNYNNQIVINLASFAQRAGWLLKNTDSAKYNYDCLTYVAVDTSYTKLKLMRIGADIDIFGTKYNGLVIDYTTNEVISSW